MSLSIGVSIIRLLKMKSRFLIAFVALPFVGVADFSASDIVSYGRICAYWYSSSDATSSNILLSPSDAHSVCSFLYSSSLGIEISGNRITHPNFTIAFSTNFSSSASIDTPLQCVTTFNSASRYYSALVLPEVSSVYSTVFALVKNGYTSPSLYPVYDSGNVKRFNFVFSEIISDVFSSTNTVYRSLVLSSLSSIGQSVLNIDSGVSELRPVLSDIKDINTSISSNSVEQSSSLRDISTNSFLAVSNLVDVVGGLGTLHDDNLANSIASFLGDDTDAWCGFVDWAVQNGYMLEAYGLEYQNALRETDPQRKGRSYSIPDSHRRFFVKNQIKHGVVEAVKMRGKYQGLMTAIVNGHVGEISSIGNTFNADVISHINNGNIERSDWRAELRQQLQDWKHSDETGILNVVDKVGKAVDAINRNLETQFPNSTNTQSFTQFVTNYVTRVITNSIERTGDNISSNVQDSASKTRDLLNDTLFNPDYDGVNVRIKFPLRYRHTEEVNVHDAGLDNLGSYFSSLDSKFDRYGQDNSGKWEELFQRWDRDLPELTNLVFQILCSLTNGVFNTNGNSYLLLDHYASYISNGVYSSSVDYLHQINTNIFDRLSEFGLSSDNAWTLFGSSILYFDDIVSTLFSDLDKVHSEYSRYSGGKSFFQSYRDTLDLFPSQSNLDYWLSVTNVANDVTNSLSDVVFRINSFSNMAYSVFRPFRGYDSLPSNLVFMKMANEKYITIPVQDQPQLWYVLRCGIAFGVVAVNFILFPRFFLLLLRLLIAAYSRSKRVFTPVSS